MFKKFTNLLSNDNRGFSLIELIVVIAILGVIAGVAIPQIGNVIERSRRNTDVSNAAVIAGALSRAIVDREVDTSKATGDTKVEDLMELETDEEYLDALVRLGYLQSKPSPKYEADEEFYAEVDENGKITVYVTASGDGENNVELYPEPEYPYDQDAEEPNA